MERGKLVCRNKQSISLSVQFVVGYGQLEFGDVGGTGFACAAHRRLSNAAVCVGMVVTAVAWSAVHAGLGYNVCDNGYKMALIYLVVLFPVLLQGAGRLSLDALLKKRCCRIKHFL